MDEDAREIERRFLATKDPADWDALQRAWARGAPGGVEFVDAVLTQELDKLYYFDGVRHAVRGGTTIVDIAAIATSYDGTGYYHAAMYTGHERRDSHDRGSNHRPFIFVASSPIDVCIGLKQGSGSYYDSPEDHWPMLKPFAFQQEDLKGEKGRQGRLRAFVERPPPGVLKFHRGLIREWGWRRLETNRHFRAPGPTNVHDAHDILMQSLTSSRGPGFIVEGSLEEWLLKAIDVFFHRALNRAFGTRPDLEPLVDLLRLNWHPWRQYIDEKAKTNPLQKFILERHPPRPERPREWVDYKAEQVRAVVREKLKISEAELADWQPEPPSPPYPQRHGAHHTPARFQPQPRPQMTTKYRRRLEREERRRNR